MTRANDDAARAQFYGSNAAYTLPPITVPGDTLARAEADLHAAYALLTALDVSIKEHRQRAAARSLRTAIGVTLACLADARASSKTQISRVQVGA